MAYLSSLSTHLLIMCMTTTCLTKNKEEEMLTDSQRLYKQMCPNQNTTLPCNPTNIDVFLASQLEAGHNLPEIIAKTFIPGTCYSSTTKYCPTILSSCRSTHNLGYHWTLQGSCLHKSEQCLPMMIEEECEDKRCPNDHYLCHPMGCVPHISACNGLCPNHLNNTGGRRILCGNSCLTKDEGRNKYDCEGVCQVKSEPCLVGGEVVCPQHFEICGEDTCIDSFVQEKWLVSTGYPLYYSCLGECNHSSTPCLLSNNSMTCPPGYLLCQDQLQCVLQGLHVRDIFFSSLCDGHQDCMDGSDESYYQCLQVYAYEATVMSLTLLGVFSVLILVICCLRSNLVEVKFYGRTKMLDMQARTYARDEDEMHLRSVAPEDVD